MSFGGPGEQKMRLEAEGIKFIDENRIDTGFIMHI